MPYTERQLLGLEALRVIPWVLRTAPVDEAAEAQGISSPPVDLNSLGSWLLNQPLDSFHYRGSNLDRLGQQAADVVIVFKDAALPLIDTQARLLTDMLQAIDLDPRNTCMVCIANAEQSGSALLSAVCSPKTRALLFFADDFIDTDTATDHAILAQDFRAWCLPTLASLQSTPQLKRHAWNSLKALQAVLSA